MPVLGGFRRAYRRATEKCDEFAPSHCPPKLGHHIVSTFTRTPEGSMSALVKTRHLRRIKSCPLCPRKRTFVGASATVLPITSNLGSCSRMIELRWPRRQSNHERRLPFGCQHVLRWPRQNAARDISLSSRGEWWRARRDSNSDPQIRRLLRVFVSKRFFCKKREFVAG
jgi:hypothetical protein